MNKNKTILLREDQLHLLAERVSSIVYHFCSFASCLGICKDNQFILSHISRGTADGNINKTRHYLSLTRQKSHKLGYSTNGDVRITLDGDKLNQRYSGGPVDYWGNSMGKQEYMRQGAERGHYDPTQNRTENEDRIFSNDPVIPNANFYIKRIDILLRPGRDGNLNPNEVAVTQEILKTGFQNVTFVYGDEASFDAQNQNIINNKILFMNVAPAEKHEPYKSSIIRALSDLLNVVTCYEHDRSQVWPVCRKLLKDYGIGRHLVQNYGPQYLKDLENDMYYKTWFLSDVFANTQNMIDTLRRDDKTLYIRGMRLFNDYLDKRNLFDLKDLYRYKKNIANKASRGEVSGLNWNKTAQILALTQLDYDPEGPSREYFGGAIAVVNPDRTSIWSVIPQEREYFVNDVLAGDPEYSSETEVKFEKYLQHIVKSNISVTQFIDFLSKLKVNQEKKDEILGWRKFQTITVSPWNYDHCHYLSDNDQKTVEQMLSGD